MASLQIHTVSSVTLGMLRITNVVIQYTTSQASHCRHNAINYWLLFVGDVISPISDVQMTYLSGREFDVFETFLCRHKFYILALLEIEYIWQKKTLKYVFWLWNWIPEYLSDICQSKLPMHTIYILIKNLWYSLLDLESSNEKLKVAPK